MAPHQHQHQQPPHVPLIFRLFFLYVEPLSALLGAYYSAIEPLVYLELTHAPTAPKNGIPISTSIILNQLSNLYFLFAVNEALVLRATEDLKVWSAVLFGLLVADFGHLYSVRFLGLQIYWNVATWNAIDWGNIGFVYAGAIMRMSFLYLAWGKIYPAGRTVRRGNRTRTPKRQ